MLLQVNEIYHDESLGVHINVVLVRMIMLGYAKVRHQTEPTLYTFLHKKLTDVSQIKKLHEI